MRLRASAVVLFILGAIVRPAQGEPITFRFDGTVDWSIQEPLSRWFSVGDAASLFVTFDSLTPDRCTVGCVSNVGMYRVTEVTAIFGNSVHKWLTGEEGFTPNGDIRVEDGPTVDRWILNAGAGGFHPSTVLGVESDSFRAILQGESVLTDDSLSTEPFDLSRWVTTDTVGCSPYVGCEGFSLVFYDGLHTFYPIHSSITSMTRVDGPPTTAPVPEPGTLLLTGVGALVAILYRRRRGRCAL